MQCIVTCVTIHTLYTSSTSAWCCVYFIIFILHETMIPVDFHVFHGDLMQEPEPKFLATVQHCLKASWFKKSPGKAWTKKEERLEIHCLHTVQDILKTNYAFDNIPCTHQPCLNKLLLEVGRPASRSLLRVHSSCGCSPCSRDLCGVAECPLRNQRPSRAALTHGWWLITVVSWGFLLGMIVRWEPLARN